MWQPGPSALHDFRRTVVRPKMIYTQTRNEYFHKFRYLPPARAKPTTAIVTLNSRITSPERRSK